MNSTDLLVDAFNRIPPLVHRAAAGLDRDGLGFRPDADANSIGWLIWHLTRVEDHHVSQLARRPQAYLEDGWALELGMEPDAQDIGYGHASFQVAAVQFDTPDTLLAYHDAVHARTLEYVAAVDAAELARIVDTAWDPPVTAGVRLISVIGDCMQHVGQANYLRGMWDRRS